MLGAGRPAKFPSIDGVRELEQVEVERLKPGREPAVKALRDSHHMIARLCAIGLRTTEIAERTGYSIARVSVLRNDPAFRELVEQYKVDVDESFRENVDEYFSLVAKNRTLSARLINDKLSEIEDLDDVSIRELVAVHSDSADRTGYPKRSVAVNVNVDFAARLDQAIQRSNRAKIIEHSPALDSSALDGEGTPPPALPVPNSRRF